MPLGAGILRAGAPGVKPTAARISRIQHSAMEISFPGLHRRARPPASTSVEHPGRSRSSHDAVVGEHAPDLRSRHRSPTQVRVAASGFRDEHDAGGDIPAAQSDIPEGIHPPARHVREVERRRSRSSQALRRHRDPAEGDPCSTSRWRFSRLGIRSRRGTLSTRSPPVTRASGGRCRTRRRRVRRQTSPGGPGQTPRPPRAHPRVRVPGSP